MKERGMKSLLRRSRIEYIKNPIFLGFFLLTNVNKLYLQKAVVPGLENNVFWSSTELDSQQAWTQSFINGTQSTAAKNVVNLVRPIRAF